MVDDLEPGTVFAPGVLEIVHRGEIHQDVEPELGLVPTPPQRLRQAGPIHHRGVIAAVIVRLDHGTREAIAQALEDLLAAHY
jgi:hypothetical protein